MTLIELIFSLILLSTFTGIFTIASGVIMKYNPNKLINIENSEGQIIDSYKLNKSIDSYQEILSQPGISKDDISRILEINNINMPKGCTLNASSDWGIPINPYLNDDESWEPSKIGYAICLRSTSVVESELTDLLSNTNDSLPGIYVLLALPREFTPASIPIRRMFCRPTPFC